MCVQRSTCRRTAASGNFRPPAVVDEFLAARGLEWRERGGGGACLFHVLAPVRLEYVCVACVE